MNTYTAHLIVTVAVLAFCTVLFVSHDATAQLAAVGFAGTVVGYWLPSPTQQTPKS